MKGGWGVNFPYNIMKHLKKLPNVRMKSNDGCKVQCLSFSLRNVMEKGNRELTIILLTSDKNKKNSKNCETAKWFSLGNNIPLRRKGE